MRPSMTTLVRALMITGTLAAWLAAFGRGGSVPFAVLTTFVMIVAALAHSRWLKAHACRVIRSHPFPSFLRDKLRAAHPQLDDASLRDVERGLRQFFVASAQAGGRFVAMPSKVVDSLWHEYILYTRGYEAFCRKAFGRMLHHTPAEALSPGRAAGSWQAQQFAGLRRAWYWSCKEEAIDPRRPARLPLLFALDSSLAIAGGFAYVPDCSLLGAERGAHAGTTHCGTSFGCGSSCGSGDSSGSSDGSSDGSSCGGDGGGDGGGGGCGGGGD
ncbi:MAG TPA: hypothetical protein VJN68_02360 [Burkholderiaceae bacterium]|nr:hypothetical protein [Burkholderiaceae bacterium]